MAKATFKRNESEGGYDARYKVNGTVFEARFTKPDKKWVIASGFSTTGREWAKLSDLKTAWKKACESDGDRAASVSAPANGPPTIPGPPKFGPPQIGGPPSLGKPITPDSPAINTPSPTNTHAHTNPDAFAAYLHKHGVLLGPCSGGVGDFRCDKCKAHVSDWERRGHDQFLPPCRCDRTHTTPTAFLPHWNDPTMWHSDPDLSMRPTAIGALDMVYNWMLAHARDCSFNEVLVDPFKTVLKTLFVETKRPEYDPEKWNAR